VVGVSIWNSRSAASKRTLWVWFNGRRGSFMSNTQVCNTQIVEELQQNKIALNLVLNVQTAVKKIRTFVLSDKSICTTKMHAWVILTHYIVKYLHLTINMACVNISP
jgi:hypothetical protein